MSRRIFLILEIIIISAASSCTALATEADQYAPSLYLNVGAGYSIYKSKMVQGNDTASTVNFGFGVFGGADHSIGMILERETSKVAFELNSSSIGLASQDLHLRWGLGPFHSGVIVSSSTWEAKAPPDADGDGVLDPTGTAEDFISIMTTGYGANLGVMILVGKGSSVALDYTFVNSGFVQSKAFDPATTTNANTLNARTVSMGSRSDINLCGSLGLTRNMVDAIAGFKLRTYNITVDDTAYAEEMNTTYLGMRLNFSF